MQYLVGLGFNSALQVFFPPCAVLVVSALEALTLRGFLFCPAGVGLFPTVQGFLFCPAGFLSCPAGASFLPCRGFLSTLRKILVELPEALLDPTRVSLLPCRGWFVSYRIGVSFLPCRVWSLSCPAGFSFLFCRLFSLALQELPAGVSFLPCRGFFGVSFLPYRGFFSALQGVPFHPEEDPCRTAGGTS